MEKLVGRYKRIRSVQLNMYYLMRLSSWWALFFAMSLFYFCQGNHCSSSCIHTVSHMMIMISTGGLHIDGVVCSCCLLSPTTIYTTTYILSLSHNLLAKETSEIWCSLSSAKKKNVAQEYWCVVSLLLMNKICKYYPPSTTLPLHSANFQVAKGYHKWMNVPICIARAYGSYHS